MGNCFAKGKESRSPRRIGPSPSSLKLSAIQADEHLPAEATRDSVESSRYTSIKVLRSALERGDVKLLKASWFGQHGTTGKRLPSRQTLERESPDAFANCAMVQTCLREVETAAACDERQCTFPGIVAVSYCWETNLHPDTRGSLLRKLAPVLEFYASQRAARDLDPDFALLIDFWSLHQSAVRTEEQAEGFRRAMGAMDVFFAHKGTVALLMTAIPDDWQISNLYADRGWPTFERALASLDKTGGLCLDVGHFAPQNWHGGDFSRKQPQVLKEQGIADAPTLLELEEGARVPPFPPAEFRRLLARKRFAEAQDRGVLAGLYDTAAPAILGALTAASYTRVRWSAAECRQLGASLGLCHSLATLSLRACGLSDEGLQALAATIPRGTPPLLETLDLSANQIGEQGAGALADAIRGTGVLPQVWDVRIDSLSPVAELSLLAALNASGRLGDAHVVAEGGRFVKQAKIARFESNSNFEVVLGAGAPVVGPGGESPAVREDRPEHPRQWEESES